MKPEAAVGEFFKSYRDNFLDNTRPQRYAVAKRVSKLRAFIKGDPTDWWNDISWCWQSFGDSPDPAVRSQAPLYNYHINLMSYGWQVLQAAIQTTGIPGSIFTPQNPNTPQDREAARVGQPISQYERTVISYRDLWTRVFERFFTDGVCLGYARHIQDRRFGMRDEKREIEIPQVSREAGYDCFQCGAFTEQGQVPRDDNGVLMCPRCKGSLHAENFVEQQVSSIQDWKTVQVPKGKEIVEIYGALEAPLPWWPSTLEHCNIIPIITDVLKEQLIQGFPDYEAEITAETGDENPDMRMWRNQAKAPMGAPWVPSSDNFLPYGRWWFRPECFFAPEASVPYSDKKTLRDKLLKDYPDGAFVQFAGDFVLDAIPEKPEDHLVLFRALPGDGMYTPSLGQNGVPIQESVNSAWNLNLEAMEFCAFAPILIDSVMLSLAGMQQTRARAGEYKSVVVPAGKSLADAYKQIEVKEMSAACQTFLSSAKEWLEMLIGTSPALAGAQMTNTRSAEQYSQARNQALQRMATPYESAKEGFAKIDEILVHEFLANRSEEEFKTIVIDPASQQQDAILLSQAQGRMFARSEDSESIPQTWAQQQSAWDQIITQSSQNPIIQSWLMDPNNADGLFKAKGLVGLTVPNKEQLDKILYRTIPMLLQSAPTMPTPGTPDPMNPMAPAQPTSSVPFDQVLDDPATVVKVIRNWAAGPQGADAQQNNEPGFNNVRLYCEGALLAMAQAAQPAPQPESQPAPTQ